MIMTSSHLISHPHTPVLSPSPHSSPSLRPLASSMAKSSPSPIPTLSSIGGPSLISPRSYARPPTERPYSLASNRSFSGTRVKPVEGDTKIFGDMVVQVIEERSRRARSGKLYEQQLGGVGVSDVARKGRSLGGSLSGSWETEKAELLVDYPVWSPGCFQDLSTLQALRDATLSRTHDLISHLMTNHSIPTSYRLLARSALGSNHTPLSPGGHAGPRSRSPIRGGVLGGGLGCKHHQVGWGCIRLAPSVSSPVQRKVELKPAVRRTSMVLPREHARKSSSQHHHPHPHADVPVFKLDLDSAIADEDEDEAESTVVELKEGYRTEERSDDEAEEECADVLVAKEVEKRGAKEGDVFLMTLFGHPALIFL